ncbi:hypothetical protein D5045_18370 [Verminephrobacter eiseniae]|nr:hypothetical protein [Verminephrobacter eiseniae]
MMPRRPALVSRHRSSVGLRWPSKRIAALHRLPIQLGMGKRCALRCAPMAARSLRHLIRDATLVWPQALHADSPAVRGPVRGYPPGAAVQDRRLSRGAGAWPVCAASSLSSSPGAAAACRRRCGSRRDR